MDAAESMAEDSQPSPQAAEGVGSRHGAGKSTAGAVPRKADGKGYQGAGEDVVTGPVDGLSPREIEVLAFERQWWKYAGAKEKAIRGQFAMSSTRYYQILNKLMEKQEAMRADPMLVKRLRKTRTARQRVRAARRLGIELP